MGSNKKRQQTISKRNRERAVEEKRRLKRERKQAIREAIRNGEPIPVDPFARPDEDGEQAEQDEPAVQTEPVAQEPAVRAAEPETVSAPETTQS
jgi:hypothetical protein